MAELSRQGSSADRPHSAVACDQCDRLGLPEFGPGWCPKCGGSGEIEQWTWPLSWRTLRVRFFPRDLWIGVFIGEREPDAEGYYRTIYICPLPMFVISFDWRVAYA